MTAAEDGSVAPCQVCHGNYEPFFFTGLVHIKLVLVQATFVEPVIIAAITTCDRLDIAAAQSQLLVRLHGRGGKLDRSRR